MKKKLIILIILLLLIIIPTAYYLISPVFRVIEVSDFMPSKSRTIFQGDFKPMAHEVEGKALLIESDGKKIIRFEDFNTINGPDLYIYLSSGLGNEDFVDLGRIKATKGDVNYDVPEGTDTSKYKHVLVWCRAFRVLFSYAELL